MSEQKMPSLDGPGGHKMKFWSDFGKLGVHKGGTPLLWKGGRGYSPLDQHLGLIDCPFSTLTPKCLGSGWS